MAQAHGDRLSAVDASFLAQERANSHMHVGAVLIFEGPAPAYDDFLNHIRSRLHLVPRYRHKLAFPPLETGRPIWVDDPSFNLEYHVRHTALPQPGLGGAAARAGRADPLAAARPRQAAVGDVARAGPRARPLRADLEVPPRARRRHLRRRPDDRALRRDADPAGRPARGRAVDRAARAGRVAARRARRSRASRKLPFELAARRAVGGARIPATSLETVKEALEGIGEVAWAGPEPRARDAAERADRPAPAARRSCATTSTTSSSSRTRSAARSTTSC